LVAQRLFSFNLGLLKLLSLLKERLYPGSQLSASELTGFYGVIELPQPAVDIG